MLDTLKYKLGFTKSQSSFVNQFGFESEYYILSQFIWAED